MNQLGSNRILSGPAIIYQRDGMGKFVLVLSMRQRERERGCIAEIDMAVMYAATFLPSFFTVGDVGCPIISDGAKQCRGKKAREKERGRQI